MAMAGDDAKDHGRELRCYLRDPDGHLIEIGQTTGGPREAPVRCLDQPKPKG
jgi:hypothetical protein